MVVYWSIKSAFDLAQYAVGASDSFKGTGVFSFIEFDRESSDNNDSAAEDKQKEVGKSTIGVSRAQNTDVKSKK